MSPIAWNNINSPEGDGFKKLANVTDKVASVSRSYRLEALVHS
jgi:hypothetical protein